MLLPLRVGSLSTWSLCRISSRVLCIGIAIFLGRPHMVWTRPIFSMWFELPCVPQIQDLYMPGLVVSMLSVPCWDILFMSLNYVWHYQSILKRSLSWSYGPIVWNKILGYKECLGHSGPISTPFRLAVHHKMLQRKALCDSRTVIGWWYSFSVLNDCRMLNAWLSS